MKSFSICHDVDGLFFAQCQKLPTLPKISLDGCKIQYSAPHTNDEPMFSMSLFNDQEQSSGELPLKCASNEALDMRTNLKHWLQDANDALALWPHFYTGFDHLDLANPKLDILFKDYQGRHGFKDDKPIGIFSAGGLLLHHGSMINGHIKADLDPQVANHPGWRTRLFICLDTTRLQLIDGLRLDKNAVFNINDLDKDHVQDDPKAMHTRLTRLCPHLAVGSLKNGKLQGLVQIFGVVPIDKSSTCNRDGNVVHTLAFIGRYTKYYIKR